MLVFIQYHSVAIFFVLGALIGSFLNVVAYRLPVIMKSGWYQSIKEVLLEALEKKEPIGLPIIDKGCSSCKTQVTRADLYNDAESIKGYAYLAWPPSSCPNCKHQIKSYENIPVISWLFLRGKCSGCQNKISIQYPLVELFTAIITAFVAYQFGFTVTSFLYAFLVWALIAATLIDFEHYLLPDEITLPFIWLGMLCAYFNFIPITFEHSFFGVIIGYLIFWSVNFLFKLLFKKEGMGHGDFKLLAMLGAWLGASSIPFIVLISTCFGSIIGIILLSVFKHSKNKPIPFGPYLVLGGITVLFFGDRLKSFIGFDLY